jgi:antitoxin (DNA-binding transcriptional repressor) of toxin-antitoxin stability system
MIVDIGDTTLTLVDSVDRAESGEEITLTRAGHPVARLVPIARSPRRPGALAGHITIAADFDATPPEAPDAFSDRAS